MASDLLSIAASGARAARGALDITAHNIANANTAGYVRRSAEMAEVAPSGGLLVAGDRSLSGVRIDGIAREADLFRQAEVRRTGADSARSSAELAGLENVEAAIEQARPYDAVVAFEASLRALAADPLRNELRTAAIGAAGAMAGSFNLAASSLATVNDGARFAIEGVAQRVNGLAEQLARTNVGLARAAPGSSDRASLLDQRDSLLGSIAEQAGVSTSFAPNGQVELRLGGPTGPVMVAGNTAGTLTASVTGSTVSFAIGSDPVYLATGALAGHVATIGAVAAARADLDAAANDIAALVNTAQANGTTPAGTTGAAMFAGSGAGGMALAFSDGAGIATAPAGAAPNSRDGGNLAALIGAMDSGGAAAGVSDAIFKVSARTADARLTGEALGTLASSARIALDQQSGVDLDREAANLVRFQQAFQASGRAMQVASNLFDTLLGIGR